MPNVRDIIAWGLMVMILITGIIFVCRAPAPPDLSFTERWLVECKQQGGVGAWHVLPGATTKERVLHADCVFQKR